MQNSYIFKNFFIFSFTLYLLLIFTNQYPSLEISSHMGFFDQFIYLKIFNSAPYFPLEEIRPHQASRFFFPYLIGTICDFLQIKSYIYTIFISFNIFINLLIIQVFLRITAYFNVQRNINLIFISALIFNAYNFRVSLYAPLMLNDILFTYGLLLITLFFIEKKISYFYIGLILCCLTRQTSLALNILFFILIFHKIFFKNNANVAIFVYGVIINCLIFFVLKNISGNFSDNNMTYLISHISAIFLFNYNFLDLSFILFRLITANFFILILFILSIVKFNLYKTIAKPELIIIFILGLSVWVQPILGSPTYTGSNISRLTILSMPVFLVLFSIILKDLKINFLYSIMIIILIFLSSMHHHYTYFFKLIFEFKNYHFAIGNMFIHVVIFILFLKSYSKNLNKKVE